MSLLANEINNKEFNQKTKRENNPAARWEKLSLAQQFSAYSLGKYGYVLNSLQQHSLVTLTLENRVASIDIEGEISFSNKVKNLH